MTKQSASGARAAGDGDEIRRLSGCEVSDGASAAASGDQVAVEIEPSEVIAAARDRRSCCGATMMIIFSTHFLIFVALVAFLCAEGSASQIPSFQPFYSFIPILSSIVVSPIVAVLWLVMTVRNPTVALKTVAFAAPILTLACSCFFLLVGDGVGLALAVLTVVAGIAQALYACWASPRFRNGYAVLSCSIAASQLPFTALCSIFLALIAAVAYLSFWTLAISCLMAAEGPLMRFTAVYILFLLLSVGWTMQVIRLLVHLTIATLAYSQFAHGKRLPGGTGEALCIAVGALSEVCGGAVATAAVGAVRAVSWALDTLGGSKEEILFSCSGCCRAATELLLAHANQWAFVNVAVRGQRFMPASRDVWRMFVLHGMGRLLGTDLTGPFCFMCSVATGATSTLVAGSWALSGESEHKGSAMPVALYAFVVGYSMARMTMAWPQACVAALHVAYAENPHNRRLGGAITERLRQLEAATVLGT